MTKARLRLDIEWSWVIVSELNDFIWPGPDLRPLVSGDLSSVTYGFLPPSLFRRFVTAILPFTHPGGFNAFGERNDGAFRGPLDLQDLLREGKQ